MNKKLKEHFETIQMELSPKHLIALSEIEIALNFSKNVLDELEISHAIIHNCLKNMTPEQRLATAIDNHIDDLSAQWAFREIDRVEIITNGQKILGDA
ncbi:hypothetical protein E0H80_10595 [Acinetobacter sp. ANC 4779]|uniref:hypothetical protein n=1 Tax=Acinetobacter sp. ANC 4779 TaxID=2529848 RepID=UPI00103DB9E8|nr:hypothetical protein [Acinetobacter sp. ANC 4779]TCB49853.1 hypothetical protein E0H80_10595 [Acinetobacter sp. ANC 4779]